MSGARASSVRRLIALGVLGGWISLRSAADAQEVLHTGTAAQGDEPFCGVNAERRRAGFSAESRYFLLADTISGFPLQAESRLQIIRVAANTCVSGGCSTLESEFESEDTADTIFLRLMQRALPLRQRLGLDPPPDSKPIAPRSHSADQAEYDLGATTLQVQLRPRIRPGNSGRKSVVQIEVRSGARTRSFASRVKYRDGVEAYRLGDLYLSPGGKTIALILRMKYRILGHAPSTYCRYGVTVSRLP